MDLRRKIITYIDHLEEAAFFEELLAGANVDTVLDISSEIIVFGNREEIANSCCFLRDALQLSPENIRKQFRDAVSTSQVFDALHESVFSGDYHVRDNAIYTLAKMSNKSSLNVFYHFRSYAVEPILNVN